MPLLGEAVSGELTLLLVGVVRGCALGSWCPTCSSSGVEGPAGGRRPVGRPQEPTLTWNAPSLGDWGAGRQ